jgi:exonuclease SbcC
LPQGQFDRFLKPERPQQRREILNKLLGVDTLIEKMAELIRETKRQIENRLESITASLHELSFATKEELERVGKEITLLEKDLNLLEEEKKKLQERLNIASHRDRLQEELTECQRQLAELLEKAKDMEQLERNLQVMEELSSYAPYVESFKKPFPKGRAGDKRNKEFKGKACQTLPSEGAVPRTVGKIPPRVGKTG